ncbi:hydroxymethylcytosylglucuronate/cytosylglucuronate synthase [Streptomyces ziwulingensis]|uniref:Hydroxymethylcytosylglucuronate/cytosylglucurona te synthase n=1 Tax=Streptomyces ziwulingensis TaxID=1045501 RepID=A0ABP9C4G7_9ACTN
MEWDSTRSSTTVALAGAEFGWGSTGKLSAVIAALRDRTSGPLRFVGLASGLSRTLLQEHGVERWYDLDVTDRQAVADVVRRERISTALVVLEGPAAIALEAAGVPTVFVDSLPFLWTDGDRDVLPTEVSVYCAQKCLDLPPECQGVLSAVTNLRWVEAVVAHTARASGPAPENARAGTGSTRPASDAPWRSALVSLGGLRSPTLTDWTCYPSLVVPATLGALAAAGVREVHVAGNLPAGFTVDADHPPGVDVTYGSLPHETFLERLADTDVLLTSPGLTTLLEAGARGRPTVCLPPQNLSQIFNGRHHSHAVGTDVRVRWPQEVFSEADVLRDRTGPEDTALRVIYGGIAAAAAGPDAHRVRADVRDAIRAALRDARAGARWTGLTDAVGRHGARQVADRLLALVPRAPAAARN